MNKPKLQTGFTVIEVLVAVSIFAISIISIATLAASLQQAHRNNQYLAIASTAAKDIIEIARNTEYGSLKYGETINKNSILPSNLPNGNASLTTVYVEGTYALKRVDVTVTYTVGTDTRKVMLSSFIGLSGITQ